MLTETQMADRLALIKDVAERRNRVKKIVAKGKAVKRYSDDHVAARKPTQNLTEKYDGGSNEFYGERYHQTTRFDNDWGDY
mgnify:CR=1 FL=1